MGKKFENMEMGVEDLRDMTSHRWNVIPEDEFRTLIQDVFHTVASILEKTLGPYGATTLIEEFGTNHLTKDGWQLLKNISPENPTDRAILKLLKSIAHQVVLKVGDGSTSSIVASDEMLKAIDANEVLKELRPKDLLNKINEVVDELTKQIMTDATHIDKDGDFEEIKNLALISTNGEEEIAEMVQRIYKETGNPAISFATSKTNQTKLEIIDGYKMNYMTYIDRLFINTDDGTSVQKNPMVVMFNHRVDEDYYDKVIAPLINVATANGHKLVVIAPYYSNKMMEKLGVILMNQYNVQKTTFSVFLKVSLINNHSFDLYNDFAALCGCTVINEMLAKELLDNDNDQERLEQAFGYVGAVGKMEIADNYTFISDFIKKDEDKMKLLFDDAVSKYNKILANSMEFEIINNDLINAKERVAKLHCKMGYIYVGGNSEIAKKANFDLVEDAVKACESAFKFGYNNGQNLAIIKACLKLLDRTDDQMKQEIIGCISNAFTGVFHRILLNKEKRVHVGETLSIIGNCLERNQAFDLVTDTYSDDIINSCMTDVEILKAVGSMVALLLSSNQMVSISSFTNLK